MAEKPLSKKLYLRPRKFLQGTKIDYEMVKMMDEVNKRLELNEEYPYLRTNASDCN